MTEGPSLAAADARAGARAAGARAAGADAATSPDTIPPGQPPVSQPEPPAAAPPEPPPVTGPVSRPAEAGRHRRVDARLLEAALLELRRRIVDVSLVFETTGAEAGRAERVKLLSQIDDYLLPRVRQSGAPLLVALVGSTGAGKSTLVNSIVGAQVSNTGIRRPTTNSPVLASHPDDVDWFAENVFLPTVPRVRQEGLARSGRDGLLVLAANEGMPKGVALLDTPDIDSVVQAHREFAHQFLDASDLWLFMTSSSRYADAAVWELLEYAKERGATLGIVLSRVPPSGSAELTKHFGAMLQANGLGDNQRFVINETVITDARLPAEVSAPVREWLQEMAVKADRRVAILTQTMAGALDTFRSRVPALAAEVEAQLTIRSDLKATVEGAYAAALAEADQALSDGSLLRGEALARWQDFAGTGELLRGLQAPRGRQPGRQRKRGAQARARALKGALRTGIESLIISVASQAAEESVRRWGNDPAGVALLERVSAEENDESWAGSQFAADAGLVLGLTSEPALGDDAPDAGDGQLRQAALSLARCSADLPTRAARAVSGWQDQMMRLVQAESVTKRSIARVVSFDDESLATVLTVAMLGQREGEGTAEGTGAVPQLLLTSLFGAGPVRDIRARARADLRDRMHRLFDEELLRFVQVVDSAGELDAAAAVRLYQATYSLEMAR
ncbi:MAG TPA: dynamin family protein [Streptosporangiaceae bacterium]|jgi:energy-coupling factor transporter ATP-binding protein EcfA2